MILPLLLAAALAPAPQGPSPAPSQARDDAARLQKQEDAIIQRYRAGAKSRIPATRGPLLPEEQTVVKRFREAKPSVVYISTLKDVENLRTGDISRIPAGTGTGFVWDDQGHVVTNHHVVLVEQGDDLDYAKEVRVTLADGKTYQARLIGASFAYDLAVLQVFAPLEDLKPLPIGTSKDLVVGQTVLAIGNPFGLDHTLTKGVISAVNRDLPTDFNTRIRGVIQTDAAINPGNSGGPLLDSAGRVIGMNSAIPAATGASVGIGFAIPIDTLNRVVPHLIRAGQMHTPRIGFSAFDDFEARGFGVARGVLVDVVEPGSPAARVGLRGATRDAAKRVVALGDIVVGYEGKPVANEVQLIAYLEEEEDKKRITLDVLREGKVVRLEIVLRDPER
ncbi:MAG TPA: trypsin-like peptidase domain-containing protein [Holophagaceae bacterium]|nr:trypsin-like peptidase domain-containing protein [Holophagaceae bacterium]